MKQISLLIIIFFGCTKDNNNVVFNQSHCLTNKNPQWTVNDCNAINGNSNCKHIYIGAKKISEKSKNLFTDFCKGLHSKITFKNQNGNELICDIDEHRFVTSRAAISTDFTSNNCKTYCLDSEEAVLGIRSVRFALDINLVLLLDYDINQEYSDDKIITSFVIWAKQANTSQYIFALPIEDAKNNEIVPDTTNIRLHNTISLNGEAFTNVYSNENFKVNGILRKEIVYFNRKFGLIAVRDSLGTLWTRN